VQIAINEAMDRNKLYIPEAQQCILEDLANSTDGMGVPNVGGGRNSRGVILLLKEPTTFVGSSSHAERLSGASIGDTPWANMVTELKIPVTRHRDNLTTYVAMHLVIIVPYNIEFGPEPTFAAKLFAIPSGDQKTNLPL
jgi:hypothetical protein